MKIGDWNSAGYIRKGHSRPYIVYRMWQWRDSDWAVIIADSDAPRTAEILAVVESGELVTREAR